MAGGKEPIEVKFRLFDGTDIGPSKYDPNTTVAALKEFILCRWPQGPFPEVVWLNETACLLMPIDDHQQLGGSLRVLNNQGFYSLELLHQNDFWLGYADRYVCRL